MAFIINQTIDLQRENTPKVYEQALEYGDRNAHEWRVAVMSGGRAKSLAGMSSMFTMKRAAGPAEIEADPTIRVVTVEYPAEIDEAGGVAFCVLSGACYTGVGPAVATMKLSGGGEMTTTAVLILDIQRSTTDTVADPTHMVPSIEELLAELGVMRETTQAAQEAADAANEAAGRAPYIDAQTGTWFVWDNATDSYVDTGSVAKGSQGEPGKNGVTPHVGENGNWCIGETDTGVPARGPVGPQGDKGDQGDGLRILGLYGTIATLQAAHPVGDTGDAYAVGTEDENVIYVWDVDAGVWRSLGALQGPVGPQGNPGNPGVTPHIGVNGNWFVGDTDTGIPATGPVGPEGPQGDDYSLTEADKQEIAGMLIDDDAASVSKTYSSQKIDEELDELKNDTEIETIAMNISSSASGAAICRLFKMHGFSIVLVHFSINIPATAEWTKVLLAQSSSPVDFSLYTLNNETSEISALSLDGNVSNSSTPYIRPIRLAVENGYLNIYLGSHAMAIPQGWNNAQIIAFAKNGE